jgi:hypothetical protein
MNHPSSDLEKDKTKLYDQLSVSSKRKSKNMIFEDHLSCLLTGQKKENEEKSILDNLSDDS